MPERIKKRVRARGSPKKETRLQAAERTLAAARRLLSSVIDNIPDRIYVKDADSRFIIVNSAVVRKLGETSPENVVGKTDFDFYPPETARAFRRDDLRVMKSMVPLLNREERTVDAAGNEKWTLTTKVPYLAHDGRIIGLVGIGRDVTERKSMEIRLRLAERMASLGRLTAGFAHEINTPLAAVRSSLAALEGLIGDYEAAAETHGPDAAAEHREIIRAMRNTAELMKKSCQHASGFIHGIKEQIREPEPRKSRTFEVRPVMEEALALLRNALDSGRCAAELVIRGGVPRLSGAPDRLALAVTNVILNAIEAESPNGGRIVVEAEQGAREVLLRVTDTGRGIPPEDLPRIFEPRFSARSFSEGTGLGLTVAHDIVCGEFGGSITAESPGGTGAVFTMRFPRVLRNRTT